MRNKGLWNYLLVFGLALLILLFNYGNYWSSHYYSKWTIAVFVFCLFWSLWVARETAKAFFPVTLVALWSASWIGVWQFNQYYKVLSPEMHAMLSRSAMYSLITVLVASFLIIHLPRVFKTPVETALAAICLLSVGYTICQLPLQPYHRSAFSGNASMNGCLIACLLPFALKQFRKRLLKFTVFTLVFIAVFLTNASIPIGVLVVVSSALFWARFGWSAKALFGALGISGFTLGLGYHFMHENLFHSTGRIQIWNLFYEWWSVHSSPWFGAGLGTGQILFPYIQSIKGVNDSYYLWAHSEWFQILFEMGWVGLISVLVAWVYLLFRSKGNPALFASFLGFSAMATFNYPSKLIQTCAPFVLVMWLILKEPKEAALRSSR